jgi:hypothetical protein
MDWSQIELDVYGESGTARGWFCAPEDQVMHELKVNHDRRGRLRLVKEGLPEGVKFTLD